MGTVLYKWRVFSNWWIIWDYDYLLPVQPQLCRLVLNGKDLRQRSHFKCQHFTSFDCQCSILEYFRNEPIQCMVTLRISTCLFLSGFPDFHFHRKPDTNLEKVNRCYSNSNSNPLPLCILVCPALYHTARETLKLHGPPGSW